MTVTRGYTVAQTARLVAALRWAAGCVADLLGAWAGEAGADGPEAAIWMAAAGRHLAWHRELLERVQPDSVRMERYRDPVPPDPRLPAAIAEITELSSAGQSGTAARLAVAQHVLIANLVDACDEVCAHAAAHCDAALASAAEAMGRDLQSACRTASSERPRLDASCNPDVSADTVLQLPEGADAGSEAGDPAEPAAPEVAQAQRALAAAGGLVPRSLLRPGG